MVDGLARGVGIIPRDASGDAVAEFGGGDEIGDEAFDFVLSMTRSTLCRR